MEDDQIEEALSVEEPHGDVAEAEEKEENAEDEGGGEDDLHLGAAHLAAATRVEDKVRGENENRSPERKDAIVVDFLLLIDVVHRHDGEELLMMERLLFTASSSSSPTNYY